MTTNHDSASDSFVRPSVGGLAPSRATPSAGDDPLSDALHGVRLRGALYFVWDVASPHVTPVPDGRHFASLVLPGAQQAASYHIVTEGSIWGGLPGQPPVHLEAGDILLVPRGNAYVMASTSAACVEAAVELEESMTFFRRMAAGELPFVVEQGRGRVRSRVICGFLGCDVRPFNPVLAALPPLVRLRLPPEGARDRLRSLLDLTLAEERSPGPGGRCVLLRLSELMFVELLRRCITELSVDRAGWLAGLGDPVVARALLLLHRRPSDPWTLARLAREAGGSRSHLADRFTRLVGQPPMQYLAQWRMQLASCMLVDTPAKIASIASEVGYGSEAAFSRAFKRLVGVSPAQWRLGQGQSDR